MTGRPPKENPRTITTKTTWTPEEHESLHRLAEQEGLHITDLLRLAVRQYESRAYWRSR